MKHGLGGGLFGKESSTNYDVYLNLTPLMDVMSNILFFLMASFGATAVSVLPTTVPVQQAESDSTPPPESLEKRVTATLRVDGQGMSLACDSPNVDPEILRQYALKLPKKAGAYDNEGLTAALRRIKLDFPDSKTMIIVPDDDLLYEAIVGIMDAARDYLTGDGKRVTMFNEVVMSTIPSAQKP